MPSLISDCIMRVFATRTVTRQRSEKGLMSSPWFGNSQGKKICAHPILKKTRGCKPELSIQPAVLPSCRDLLIKKVLSSELGGAKIIAPGLKQHSGSMPGSDVRPQLFQAAACTLQEFSTSEQIALDAPCRANRPRLSQTGVHVSLMNIHEAPGSQEPVRANSAPVTLRDASLVMCLLESMLPATASWRASNQRLKRGDRARTPLHRHLTTAVS